MLDNSVDETKEDAVKVLCGGVRAGYFTGNARLHFVGMEKHMRKMEFKMERQGLLETGQKITVTEGLLPSNYYYVIDPSLAMSANIPFRYRLQSREGVVVDIVENARGFYVTAEFDEPEVDMSK